MLNQWEYISQKNKDDFRPLIGQDTQPLINDPGLKNTFVAKLCVVLNFCTFINNKLTPYKNLKRLDFDQNMLLIPH